MKKLTYILISLFVFGKFGNVSAQTAHDEKEIFRVVEQQAEFPGGFGELGGFIQKNMIYPPEAKKKGIVGKPTIKFVINEDGKITNAVVAKSCGSDLLDKEAIRIVNSMPAWQPAQMTSKPVKCYFNLPIAFDIDGKLAVQNKKQHNLSIEIYESGMKDFQNKNFEAAKTKFYKAYDLNDRFENALYNLGIVYHNLGKNDSACTSWNELYAKFNRKDAQDLIKKYCN